MKTFYLVTLVSVSLLHFLTSDDDGVFPASITDVTGLLGASPYRYCIYENTVTCDHALPVEDCDKLCEYHDSHPPDHPAWGWFGVYKCPEGMDIDIQINELSTTIARNDTVEDGWGEDKLKEEAELCNTVFLCDCASYPLPGKPGYIGHPPCEPMGPQLPSPTVLLREPAGDQDCNPFEPDY